MKKTLLASAIAAAAFSGAVAASSPEPAMTTSELTEKMNTMPTFYGNIQYAYTYTDSDVNGNERAFSDNGYSTIGVTHSHAITPDVEAFMKIELQGFGADDGATSDGISALDEAYIGVRGDSFGRVWIGSDDTQYEQLLGDYGDWVFEIAALNPYASYTTGEGDMLQYASPSFGGLTLHAGMEIQDNGQGNEKRPYQLGVSYSMSGLTASLVMDSNDGAADTSNENSYGVSFAYALNALVLDAYYDTRKGLDGAETSDFDLDGEEGRDQFGLMATYNMGPNTFRAAYEMASADTSDLEVEVISLQALHNFSDNLYVFTEVVRRDNDNSSSTLGYVNEEINQLNVGGVYYF
jgi:predicted porin